MKKSTLLFLFVCCLFSLFLSAKPMILILSDPNPTILENLYYLIQTKKIDAPELQIIGVYHVAEESNFIPAQQWAKEKGIDWLRWEKLTGDVATKDLFHANAWTESFQALFAKSHGTLVPGGPDLPPAFYGEKTDLLTRIERTHRHACETSWLFHLLGGSQNPGWTPWLKQRPNYVVWGICLGMQTMNVANGGTLYQDIPKQVYGLTCIEDVLQLPWESRHKNYLYTLSSDGRLDYGVLHPIVLQKQVPFAKRFGSIESPLILSIHHQAVKDVAKDFEVWAMSKDGKIVEGIAHRFFPHVIAMQFHPERHGLWDHAVTKPMDFDGPSIATVFYQQPETVNFHLTLWQIFVEHLRKSAENSR